MLLGFPTVLLHEHLEGCCYLALKGKEMTSMSLFERLQSGNGKKLLKITWGPHSPW